jgi:hypothetical protein
MPDNPETIFIAPSKAHICRDLERFSVPRRGESFALTGCGVAELAKEDKATHQRAESSELTMA